MRNLNLNKPIKQWILSKTMGLIKGEASMTTNSIMFGARRGFLLLPIAIALTWFALSPVARAVSPAPDGGYPNFNTAEGDFALNALSTGEANTAIGYSALSSNTTGVDNTATGPPVLVRS
jgi:hypothetical protein